MRNQAGLRRREPLTVVTGWFGGSTVTFWQMCFTTAVIRQDKAGVVATELTMLLLS